MVEQLLITEQADVKSVLSRLGVRAQVQDPVERALEAADYRHAAQLVATWPDNRHLHRQWLPDERQVDRHIDAPPVDRTDSHAFDARRAEHPVFGR